MNSRAESAEQMNPRQIKVLLFGASGMLGAAVMRECLADPQVATVMTVGRSASALHSTKLEEIVHADLSDYSAIETRLTDLDACFFCLGVSSAGLSEAERTRCSRCLLPRLTCCDRESFSLFMASSRKLAATASFTRSRHFFCPRCAQYFQTGCFPRRRLARPC